MTRKLICGTLSVVVFASLATTSFAQDAQARGNAHRNVGVSAKASSSQKPLPQVFRDGYALMPGDGRISAPSNVPGAPAQPAQY